MIEQLTWRWRGWGYEAHVAVFDARGSDTWHLRIQKRPGYCDRGRWEVWVDNLYGRVSLDTQEGFPRYFFSLVRAQAEMLEWVNARQEVRDAS